MGKVEVYTQDFFLKKKRLVETLQGREEYRACWSGPGGTCASLAVVRAFWLDSMECEKLSAAVPKGGGDKTAGRWGCKERPNCLILSLFPDAANRLWGGREGTAYPGSTSYYTIAPRSPGLLAEEGRREATTRGHRPGRGDSEGGR